MSNKLVEDAKSKITKEMAENKGQEVQVIGKYLLKQIEINKDAAEKIKAGDKTIVKAFKQIEDIARKKATKGMYAMEEREVFEIVRKYYELEAIQDKIFEIEIDEIQETHGVKAKEPIDVDFNYSIEDFM